MSQPELIRLVTIVRLTPLIRIGPLPKPGVSHTGAVEEWFRVSREGKVEQMTHFAQDFPYADIGHANWSPDGERLAFWVKTTPNPCGDWNYLAVLDRESQPMQAYCIGTLRIDDIPPKWSPDSRFLAFSAYDVNGGYVILVDTEKGWAAQVGKDLFPVGWLAGN